MPNLNILQFSKLINLKMPYFRAFLSNSKTLNIIWHSEHTIMSGFTYKHIVGFNELNAVAWVAPLVDLKPSFTLHTEKWKYTFLANQPIT